MNNEPIAATQENVEQAEQKVVEQKAEAPAKAKKVKKNIYQKLFAVQQNLKAHKGQHNDYGGYNYRSAEDILEAVKPLLREQECIIIIKDEIFTHNQMAEANGVKSPVNYIKATIHFIDIETGDEVTADAYARECRHTGMSEDQCTGCASSYARKYALNALLCIDNTADSDSNEVAKIERNAKQQSVPQGGNQQNNSSQKPWGNSNNNNNKSWGK